MAFDFKNKHVDFVATTGAPNVQRGQEVSFASTVRRADVAIKGFDIGYKDGDHNVWREKINVSNVQVVGNAVRFDVEYLFRDSSGNIDDRYSGSVDLLVLAEVA